MVLCIGEILVDMIGQKSNGQTIFSMYAGGAPFNVACDIASLQKSSGFIGLVGDDLPGRFLVDFAQNRGLQSLHIARDGNHNTTMAFVSLSETGERAFCFLRKQSADYQFSVDGFDYSVLQKAKIIHLGTLMLSEENGRNFATKIIEKAHAFKKMVSIDINYRSDIYQDDTQAMSFYQEFIEKADIVKYSEEELYQFTNTSILDQALTLVANDRQLIAVTLGSNGSAYAFRGHYGIVPSIQVTPVDTTGAGDGFFAALLSQLDETEWQSMNENKLRTMFQYANVCGALTTLKKGAIDGFPTLEEIHLAMHGIQS